ncbi:4-hydroxybenzoate octaprenyltransferase [Legionella impletisoli]|uniref:4-hydroxybenzoate octaprenyltransferase n=1 Tax=Legionella impletisoli TaxID=343510 RepID=A0A917JRB5_9GAMM|nr:4-hydroxybenzoate octaprenyltransferase [Legionella impletisoli]GGI77805.1 4-hydroxybenzoate octaprenyltransferase [Legionella impletisoli]
MKVGAYLRLMRFDKPVGTLLLWLPTAWALWISNQGKPAPNLLFIFLFGTIIMRAAGCVINDIADRDIDKYVKRTKLRPLTHGEISLKEAFIILIALLSVALLILLQLPYHCFFYALMALGITILYPFCKRIIQAPQLVLGIAFSMAIPMVYCASGAVMSTQMMILMVLNTIWIISYDTMYAMVDRADDLQIGVRSTAILFAHYDRFIIFVLQSFFHMLWLYLAIKANLSSPFYIAWFIGIGVLTYLQYLVNTRNEMACFQAFLMNVWYGVVMWVGLIMAY